MTANFSTITDYTSFLKSIKKNKISLNEAGFSILENEIKNTNLNKEKFKTFNRLYSVFIGKTTLNQNAILSSLITAHLNSKEPQNAFFYCNSFYSATLGVSYSTIKRTIRRLLELQILVKRGELSVNVASQMRILNAFCLNVELLENWLESGLNLTKYYKGIFGKESSKNEGGGKKMVEIEALKDEVRFRDEEILRLKQEIEALRAENKAIKESASGISEDLQTSLEMQKGMVSENEYLKEEIKTLKQQPATDEDLQNSNKMLEITAQRLTDENEALKKENESLNKKLEIARVKFREKNNLSEIQKNPNLSFSQLLNFVEKQYPILQAQCNPSQREELYNRFKKLASEVFSWN